MRFLMAFSLTTIVAAPLLAQERQPPPPDSMPVQKHSDESGNRRGSLFIAPSGKPFRSAPGAPYPMDAWFAEADANHDGRLTMVEMRADAARFFAELDTNHDGEIDPDEVGVYETVLVPEIQTGGFDGGRAGGFSAGGGAHRRGGRHGGGGPGRGTGEAGQGETRTFRPMTSDMGRGAERIKLPVSRSLVLA
ncbi:MAG: hypothetical protein ABI898_05360 [Sphingomonadales bacterium]